MRLISKVDPPAFSQTYMSISAQINDSSFCVADFAGSSAIEETNYNKATWADQLSVSNFINILSKNKLFQDQVMKQQLYMKNPSLFDLFSFDSESLKTRREFHLTEAKKASQVLEIGAGTGALYLAEHGLNVTCVEPSPTVLINLTAKIFNSVTYKKKVTLLPLPFNEIRFGAIKFDHLIIPMQH